MEKKMTIKEQLMEAATVVREAGREDLAIFLEDRAEKSVRKANSKGMTKTQKGNAEIKEALVDTLAKIGSPISAKGILAEMAEYTYKNAKGEDVNLTVQKVSALLNQLVKTGEIVKTTEKGKSYFSVVA